MTTLKERVNVIETIDVDPEAFARITGQPAELPVLEVREATLEEYLLASNWEE